MKAILKSESPKSCELILNGKKMMLLSKTRPKIETPFKCYIYCTKGNEEFLYKCGNSFDDEMRYELYTRTMCIDTYLNGKVICEFVCDKIYEIVTYTESDGKREAYIHNFLDGEQFEAMTCLKTDEVAKYLGYALGYGWHISELKIYDEPKELREFKTPPCYKPDTACRNCKWRVEENTPEGYESECYVENGRSLTRAPQSWQYVEELEG